MNTVIALYVTATTMLQDAAGRLRSEEGQTSVEWLGIAFVIVTIIGLIVGNATSMSDAIKEAFTSLIGRATS